MIPDKELDNMRTMAGEILKQLLREHPTDKTMDEAARRVCRFVQTFLSLDDWLKADGVFPTEWNADKPHLLYMADSHTTGQARKE